LSARLSTHAHPALSWSLALVVYVVVSYPYHAVLLTTFGGYPQAVYIALCGFGLLLLFAHRRTAMPVEYSRVTGLVIAAFVGVMALSYLHTRNPTVIRELLLLGIVILVFLRIRGVDALMVLRALVYIAVIFLLPALVVVALFYSGAIDWPNWRVERLGLAPSNPVLVRGLIGNFEYYLPMWLAFVPHGSQIDHGFGLVFVRQPLVYIEPTDTWLYCAGLFWLAVADERMALRRLCIAVLGVTLAVSFSAAGVLATMGSVLICIGVYFGGRTLMLAVLGGFAVLVSLVPLEVLLGFVAENKAAQLEFYSENIQVLTEPTMFGNADFTKQGANYGLLTVLDRYGMVGLGYLLIALAVFAATAFHLLNDRQNLGWRRFPLFIGSAVTLAMTAKYPGLVPAMPALCLAATLSFRQYLRNPFDAAAVRS
jgi:hypothetical protein